MAEFALKRRAAMDAVMKEEVYQQAVDILTNHGPQALTMDRLAGAIGVSRGTLYNYFPDRDAVLAYVDQQAFEPLILEIGSIVADKGTAEEKLTRIARAILGHAESSKPLVFALLFKEVFEGERREAQIRRIDQVVAQFVKVFEQGMREGEFRKLPLPDAAVMFVSVLKGHVEYLADRDFTRPAEEIVSTLMEMILPAFRRM